MGCGAAGAAYDGGGAITGREEGGGAANAVRVEGVPNDVAGITWEGGATPAGDGTTDCECIGCGREGCAGGDDAFEGCATEVQTVAANTEGGAPNGLGAEEVGNVGVSVAHSLT